MPRRAHFEICSFSRRFQMPIASDVDSNNFEKRHSFRDTSDRERTEERFGKERENNKQTTDSRTVRSKRQL